jgi:subtilisin family serine protease
MFAKFRFNIILNNKIGFFMKRNLIGLLGLLALIAIIAIACNREGLSEDPAQLREQLVQDGKLITYASEVIPGRYIVVFKQDALSSYLRTAPDYPSQKRIVAREAGKLLRAHRVDASRVDHSYASALQGFSANLSELEAMRIAQDPQVAYVEEDQLLRLEGGPPGGGSSCANNNSETTPCGITVVKGGANYTGNKKAYILDTGIDLTHPDLNVNASLGFNAFSSGPDAGSLNDGNGHGSHVAGTVGAIGGNGIGVVGVAAGATVVPVKVLDRRGSGSISGVIAGVDFVGANGSAGDVANMSLGGGASSTLDNAVVNASSGGIWFVIAAGNSSADANNYSPARANGPYVRTISAMNCSGQWASFSNFGNPPIDFCAPGVSVCSTYRSGGYASLSGTSMAAPHAAGVILATGGNPKTCGNVSGDPDGNPDPIICK